MNEIVIENGEVTVNGTRIEYVQGYDVAVGKNGPPIVEVTLTFWARFPKDEPE
jgi:hypothetical protein